jgi:hypothetical protein
MDYKKIYDDFMCDRLIKKPERLILKKDGNYFEGHHIIPKSKGGTGNSSRPKNNPNIVLLTAREHFLAHRLLWRIYRDRSSALAFHKMMSINKNQNRITSTKGYEEARLAFRLTNIGNQYGKGKTRIVSEEQRKKRSIIMKGKFSGDKNPFFNKKHTEETKDKLRKSREGINKDKIWNYKGKKIVLKGDLVIAEFDTSQEVAKFIGCSYSNVRHVLGGKQKTAKGYQIKYKNDDEVQKILQFT